MDGIACTVECGGELIRIPIRHSFITVEELKSIIRDKFRISQPFNLTYNCAELNSRDSLHDLDLDFRRVIRVRQKAIKHIPRSSLPVQQPQNTPAPSVSDPVVFLSYEWTHQTVVALLKTFLEAAGFSCWLDIRQMHPGDSLHPSIDLGIRQAKVFICCINRKYGNSDNCRRELSLASCLRKPIIPLIVEPLTWPPERIGSLLAELIYIKFHTGNDQLLPWPENKFNELVDQLARLIPEDRSHS